MNRHHYFMIVAVIAGITIGALLVSLVNNSDAFQPLEPKPNPTVRYYIGDLVADIDDLTSSREYYLSGFTYEYSSNHILHITVARRGAGSIMQVITLQFNVYRNTVVNFADAHWKVTDYSTGENWVELEKLD